MWECPCGSGSGSKGIFEFALGHGVSRSRCTAGSNRADGAAVDSGKEKGNGGSNLSEGQRSKRENYKGSEIAR